MNFISYTTNTVSIAETVTEKLETNNKTIMSGILAK
jgi:hypothetical protein